MLGIALILSCPVSTFGQDSEPATPAPQPAWKIPSNATERPKSAELGPLTDQTTYVIKLTEFRFKTPIPQELSSQDILQQFAELKDSDQLELIDTIRMSVLGGHESMVMFGRRTAVTTGVTGFSRGPEIRRGVPLEGGPGGRTESPNAMTRVRATQDRELGTLLRVTARTEGDKVLVNLQYEASRIEGEIPEDTAPDTTTVRVSSTMFVERGKPMLLTGSNAKMNSYLVLFIE
jgi:hypothetical protein